MRGLSVTILCALLAGGNARGEDGSTFFESKIRPILVTHCYDCHSEKAGKRKGGLWLDRREGWQLGGDAGPAIFPGKVEQSLLIRSVRYLDESLQMPPKSRLSADEVRLLEQWVAMGAPDPRDAAMAKAVRKQEIDYTAARKSWAFRPHRRPPIPSVHNSKWSRGTVDKFILARLEEQQLRPADDAKPNRLLRRLHYDLTGLPPTPAEVAAFTKDPSPKAFASIVDELLSRKSFGEKWGRHWLDVARYSDSNGGDRNFTYYQAWRYRNYVIDSFNQDRPFHEFVRQQLAGDLMPAVSDQQRHDQLVASTFLALGPKMLTERDKEKLRLDTADEQIDTVGRAFLGLTLGCARCHEHKFDPVTQEDYYALAGIFRSTQVVLGTRNGCVNVASWVEQPLPMPAAKQAELQTAIDRMELAMRLTVEKSFRKKAGGKKPALDRPFAGIIYDEADAELTGTWRKSTLNDNRFGAGYVVYDRGTGPAKATFRASLPENGTYEVRIAYSYDRNRASNIPVTVEAWDKIHEVRLDETQAPNVGRLFQTIGRFKFEKGGRANVIIDTAGIDNRFVIVDAVQFISIDDIDHEATALAKAGPKQPKSLFQMSDGELKKELGRLINQLKTAEVAMVPRDAKDPGDIHLRVRGVPGQLGPLIPRGFPRVLDTGSPPDIPPDQSGRLQLADWITSPANALLDRVMVNRVWHHLFGRGIVASVDNFGTLGTGPSHPKLLDHLASRFRDSGGSVKQLIRELVVSRAYQLSVDAPQPARDTDPENSLFSHQTRRRLTAEEIRDSALFLAGRLDTKPGTATSTKYGQDLDKPMSFAKETLRTIYLPIARNNLVAELELFDAANPDLVSGSRATTTVPTQALYLLNNDFFHAQSETIGKAAYAAATDDERIRHLYETILNRAPDYIETKRALEFLQEIAKDMKPEQAHGHLAHLLLVSTEFLFLD